MYMAFQNCHGPVQAPEKYTEKYSFITDETRRTYAGMVSITDEAIGNITQTMKDAGYGPFFLLLFNFKQFKGWVLSPCLL